MFWILCVGFWDARNFNSSIDDFMESISDFRRSISDLTLANASFIASIDIWC